MSNQQKIYNLLKKVEEVQGTKTHKLSQIKKAVKTTTAFGLKLAEMKKNKKVITPKKPQIKLAKVDELDYDYSTTEEELSRISYFVDEFFDEQFEAARTAWMTLNDVFKNNSENFFGAEEFTQDKQRLQEIQALAEELGVDVTSVYPDWQSHIEAIESFEYYEEQYAEKEREFDTYFG
jgi:predicted ATPase